MSIPTMSVLTLIQFVQLCTSLIASRIILKGVSHATGQNKMALNTTMYFDTFYVAVTLDNIPDKILTSE